MNIATIIRSYSTKTSLVQPPIRLFNLEGRYATALYSAASKKKELEKVETDLRGLKELISKDTGVQSFFNSPQVSSDVKKRGLETIVKSKNFGGTVANLLTVLSENGRLKDTPKVIDSFEQIMSAHRGEVQGIITSAQPLEAKVRSQLEASIKKNFIKSGQKLILVSKVNPSIIGGLIVEVGDKTVDMSVASKLKKINLAISEAI